MFSPPYGENPLSHGLRRASSPERGSLVQGKWQLQKLSLRESWRAAPERVLRGEVEVWYKDFDGMAKKFLPPYGDCTNALSPLMISGQFSPPYGDGTRIEEGGRFCYRFSPPYGDGTKKVEAVCTVAVFSPPYGDGTNMKKSATTKTAFSPPYGDGTHKRVEQVCTVAFSPPYGDGTSIMDNIIEMS